MGGWVVGQLVGWLVSREYYFVFETMVSQYNTGQSEKRYM